MQWLSQNWPWVAFVLVMLGMHVFGHGGHGRGHERAPAGKASDQDKRTEHPR